jgi:hypothetical protein
LVFIDETSKDSRDARRKYGRAKKGEKVVNVMPNSRGKRVSALAAICTDGFINWAYTNGTFTRKKFHKAFVEHILPYTNPWPLPRSIIILDNATIHMYPELAASAAMYGVVVVYLSPYCPFLNPIEFAFGLVKAFVRKECRIVWHVAPDKCMTAAFMRYRGFKLFDKTFSHCGYLKGNLKFVIPGEAEVDDEDEGWFEVEEIDEDND